MARPAPNGAPYRSLGERIARLRIGRGTARRPDVSQGELAERVGIAQTYVSAVERGLNRPEPETLRQIARALTTSYMDLAILAGYADPPTNYRPSDADADWFMDKPDTFRRGVRRMWDSFLDSPGAIFSSDEPPPDDEGDPR